MQWRRPYFNQQKCTEVTHDPLDESSQCLVRNMRTARSGRNDQVGVLGANQLFRSEIAAAGLRSETPSGINSKAGTRSPGSTS